MRQREKVRHFQDEVTESLWLASGGFSLAHLLGGKAAAMLRAALWRGPHGKKTEGRLQPTVSKELRPSVQHPARA